MAYQREKSQQIPEQSEKLHEEKTDHREPVGLPNSFMLSAPFSSSGMPNSIMREMMSPRISAAEEEADRLSAGIRYGSPDSVRREMADRLDSDFSSVRFHSDTGSIRKNEDMGARAYTQGSDIYFGRGGFEPRIAAHELVHTVQQGAVKGSAAQHVPSGTVQRWWFFGKKKSKYDNLRDAADEADFLFRTQAGLSATEEKQNAERDTAYQRAFQREIGRGRNRDRADSIAENAKYDLKTSSRSIISSSDRENFSNTIRSVDSSSFYSPFGRLTTILF